MKIAATISRILLGLIFLVFGFNVYLRFIPMPPPTGNAADFMRALFNSGYMHVVADFQIIGGFLLLIGRFVPLGLTLVGPVIVNIMLFHIFMAPSGLPLAILVSILSLIVLAYYRQNFAGLVKSGEPAK